MRVIFCGSRDWTDEQTIRRDMIGLASAWGDDLVVVQGEARGADSIARDVANSLGIPVESYPADWRGSGRAAGPIRNRQMLDSGTDLVMAYKEGFDWELRRGGTENMVQIALAAGVPVHVRGGL